jgi:transposase-like protein
MPEELWRAAAEVAESEGISAVARALGLNYGNLKRRVRGSERRAKRGLGAQPLFVELGRAAAVVEPRCVFEIEDRRGGRRMAIRFEGQGPAELAALGGALWKACR